MASQQVKSGLGPTAKSRRVLETSDAGWIVLQNPVVFIGDRRPEVWVAGLSPFPLPRHRHAWLAQLLRWATSCRRWWVTPEQLDEPLQILRGCGEQYLISRPVQTSQPKPVKPQDALHMCKPHLYLLALAA